MDKLKEVLNVVVIFVFLFIASFYIFGFDSSYTGKASLALTKGTVHSVNLTIENANARLYWSGFYGNLSVGDSINSVSVNGRTSTITKANLSLTACSNTHLYAINTTVPTVIGDYFMQNLIAASPSDIDSLLNLPRTAPLSGTRIFNETYDFEVGNRTITLNATLLEPKNSGFYVGVLKDPSSNKLVFVTKIYESKQGFDGKKYNYQLLLPAPKNETLKYNFFVDITDRGDCDFTKDNNFVECSFFMDDADNNFQQAIIQYFISGTGIKIYENSFSSGGNFYLGKSTYDVLFETKDDLKIKLLNASTCNVNFSLEELPVPFAGTLKTWGVRNNNGLSFNKATLTLNYSDITFTNEDNLKVLKCDDYDFDNRKCNTINLEVNNELKQDKNLNVFFINVTSFSAFSIVESGVGSTASSAIISGGKPYKRKPKKCIPTWKCTQWSPCGIIQTRKCVDLANCGLENPFPTKRKCKYKKNVKPSCNDGIQNQKEDGIDCGGPCKACSVIEQIFPELEQTTSENFKDQNLKVLQTPNKFNFLILIFAFILMIIALLLLAFYKKSFENE